jgi:hypothetical protein
MNQKAKSPFAGIKLSDQTPMSGGLDQRLFTTPPPAPPKERQKSQETRNPGTQEAGTPGNQEPRKMGSWETTHVLPTQPTHQGFDLRQPATEKQTFTFSLDEVAALDELKLELRRKFDLKTTKYELARLAIHTLVSGYKEQGTASLLIRSLREKQIPGNQEGGKPVSQKDGKLGNQETG